MGFVRNCSEQGFQMPKNRSLLVVNEDFEAFE